MHNVNVHLQFLQECNFYTNIWRFYSFKCFKQSLSNSIFYWFLFPSAEIFVVPRVYTLARTVRNLQNWSFFNDSRCRYMAKKLPIRHKTAKKLILLQYGWWKNVCFVYLIIESQKKPQPQPSNSLTKRYASKVFITNFILFAAAYVFTVVSIIWNFARYLTVFPFLSEASYEKYYNIHGWTDWYIIVRHTATNFRSLW